MHTLHVTVAVPHDRLITTTSPAFGSSGFRRSAAAFGAVLWAIVAAVLAVSTVAFAGPVDVVSCSASNRPDARWVTRLGRPDHRPLSLTATGADFDAESTTGGMRPHAIVAAGDRWWAHVGVPEGVTVASQVSAGSASAAVDRLGGGQHDGADRRFFIGDGVDGMQELQKAEAAVSGNAVLRTAYATYAAAASMTSATDRFLGLATPVFGSKFRLPTASVTGWEPLGGGGPSGVLPAAVKRPSFTTGGAVPVGTDRDADRGSPVARPRTAANTPDAPSSGMLATILGNSGGFMVWQFSRRRRTSVRAGHAAAA